MRYYPNLNEETGEFVLYNSQTDRIVVDRHKTPKIYPTMDDAEQDDKNSEYMVIEVQDLSLHHQDYLINYWNQNLKYIKK